MILNTNEIKLWSLCHFFLDFNFYCFFFYFFFSDVLTLTRRIVYCRCQLIT